ncbi:hypothetical protein DBR17_17805 [Sphingomonas sp. HMWF008]|nr:hypothetical protein DBR17_17805 [Sphingomonas sp. HMWF008]
MSGPPELPPAGIPPEEAIAFFRAKGYRIGFNWQDVFKIEHVRWFTVAKAMSRSVLEDIREAVDAAIADGTTLADFKKELRPKLQAKGWWGRKPMIDPLTGENKVVQLGSERRLKTIFNINLRTAYQAGKWERIQRTKAAFPYLEYTAVMDGRERPQHHAWDGTILPADHPWWDTHYGPCDWNCRCTAVQRSVRAMERLGLTVTEEPVTFPPEPWTNTRTGETGTLEGGIGKGWDYNVGKEYLRGLAPSPLPESFGGADEVGAAAAGEQYRTAQLALVDRFLKRFDVAPGKEAIWMDRDGWPLAIGRSWFLGQNGDVRLPKGAGAGALIDRIAAAIVTPDAIRWIWVRDETGRAMLFRRYTRRSAGLVTTVDVGGVGWRWSVGRADAVAAAYDPRQPRDKNGRWTSHGRLSAVTTETDPDLTAAEHRSILDYTAIGYVQINAAARGHETAAPYNVEHMRNLDAAIERSRLTRDVELFRGLSGDGVRHIESLDLAEGSIFADPGYTSTSKNYQAARAFERAGDPKLLLVIRAKAGTKALDVTRSSSQGTSEYEVLFPRGARWKVKKIDAEKSRIEIEAVA